MEKDKKPQPSIAENIQTLEACVKKIQKLSEDYVPVGEALKGWGYAIDNSLDSDDPCWEPIKIEDKISFYLKQFKTAVSSLIEQKDQLTQTQFYAIQNRTLEFTDHVIKVHRLEDATQFTHLISSGELEGRTSPMKKRSEKVKQAILSIVDIYKSQHKKLSGGMFSRASVSDSNKQYRIEKCVEKLMDEVKAGKFGEEFKGEGRDTLYNEIEKKFFGSSGRYPCYDF